MTQKGVGQGTVTRLRRNPRERVEDVAVTEASGLSLGPDGYPHPIETDKFGDLKTTPKGAVEVLEAILEEIQSLREALVLADIIEEDFEF